MIGELLGPTLRDFDLVGLGGAKNLMHLELLGTRGTRVCVCVCVRDIRVVCIGGDVYLDSYVMKPNARTEHFQITIHSEKWVLLSDIILYLCKPPSD